MKMVYYFETAQPWSIYFIMRVIVLAEGFLDAEREILHCSFNLFRTGLRMTGCVVTYFNFYKGGNDEEDSS